MKDLNNFLPTSASFEAQYIFLREKEGRLYTDDELRLLPEIAPDHPMNKEWKLRKLSADRLLKYIKKQDAPLHILEIGCGNGWLSNQLSLIDRAIVTGIDINKTELQQARKVFTRDNLSFFYADIRNMPVTQHFDLIVFAASFQYFPSAVTVLEACLDHLASNGEVHILDTFFYDHKTYEAAQERSTSYFKKNQVPGLKDFYFHHTLEDLEPFKYNVLYQPDSLAYLFKKRSPFQWIRIKNQ